MHTNQYGKSTGYGMGRGHAMNGRFIFPLLIAAILAFSFMGCASAQSPAPAPKAASVQAAPAAKPQAVKDMAATGERLVEIIKSGDLPSLGAWIAENKAEIGTLAIGQEGRSPLQVAASFGGPESMDMLVKAGADINAVNKRNESVLSCAILSSRENVKYLVAQHVSLTEPTGSDSYMTLALVNAGDWKTALLLLDAGADFKKKTKLSDRTEISMLAVAADRHRYTLCKELLKRGASISEKVNSPLIRAASKGNIAVVDLLVRSGADLNMIDDTAMANVPGPAAGAAIMDNQYNASLYLLKRTSPDLRIPFAGQKYPALDIYLAVVSNLLQQNRPVNTDLANTLIALSEGSTTLKKLPDIGIDAPDKEGKTALIKALGMGDFEAAKYLIDQGADLNHVVPGDGGSPLLYATCMKGSVEIVKTLVENGADINIKTAILGTALCGAALTGDVEVVKYLLSNKASVDLSDGAGFTPFLNCARSDKKIGAGSEDERLAVMKLLVAAGADITRRNVAKKSALDLAKEGGQRKLVSYLEGIKAN